jgi:hypothetical protein
MTTRKHDHEKPVSLYPLTLEEAVDRVLRAGVVREEKPGKRQLPTRKKEARKRPSSESNREGGTDL